MLDEWLSAPRAYPEARRAIGALESAAREALDRALEPMRLHAGETLYGCGDLRDAAFMILGGHISLRGTDAQGRALRERVLEAGEGLGEIGLASGGPHNTTARAVDDVRVLRLDKAAFNGLCEKYPEAMSRLAAFITPVAHETLLARVICDLLGERDAAQLGALLAEVESRELKRGDLLFQQGDDADVMFVVIYGRLRMVAQDAEGNETVIDEIGSGGAFGQRSLLAGDAHSTTVYALRDSAVGVIARPVFENLKREYPEVITRLSRVAMRRLQRRAAMPDTFHTSDAVSFVVLPVGAAPGSLPVAAFVERLAAALSACGSSLHLSSGQVDAILGKPGMAQVDAADAGGPALAHWLQQQEQSHCYMIYEADEGWSPWTERCLRMADRVLLVGDGASAPASTEFDERLAACTDCTATELVLLQPDHISRPSGTAAWLDHYPSAAHHHVRMGRAADFERLVRRISGRGLGLVLGGGAARGFAHIGVIKALAEYGVTVDLVGGTSMGAVLSATFAMGLSCDDTMKLAQRLATPFQLFDPTIPVVSFFASDKVTRVLERIYGDTQIEDLWTPCFCVSSNLTRAVPVVHRRGPLWRAVRASMAIPGVFSPILAEGELLVDGCVLNNLPIDVMQRLNHDGPIIAVNVFPDVDLLRDYRFGPSVSGWTALLGKLNPLKRRDRTAPLIFESLLRVLALNDVHQAKTKRGFADVYIRPPVEQFNILDFGAYRAIADIGYHSAVESLAEWEALPIREAVPCRSDPDYTVARLGSKENVTSRLDTALAELEGILDDMS